MNAEDIIDQLPYEFEARLECDPFFADIVVVVAEKGNVALEYSRKQSVISGKGGKVGVAVVILQLVADDLSNNLQFGPMKLKPAFQVIENVELNNGKNGTGKSGRKVARKLRDVIKGCNLIGLVQDMRTATPCIEPVALEELAKACVGHQVNFECLEVSQQTITQVQMPVVVQGTDPLNPAFQITCATPGAAIWYTTDDTYPVNGTFDDYPGPDPKHPKIGGSTAQLYTAPVPVPPGGFTVRLAAYMDGAIASSVNRFTVVPIPV